MCERHSAARGQRRAQPLEQALCGSIARDKHEPREEQDADGLADIEQALHLRVAEDLAHLLQVRLQHGRGAKFLHQLAAMRHRQRVTVDVDHPTGGGAGEGHLMGAAEGGQAGAEVEKLGDAVLQQAGDDAPEKGTVDARHQGEIGIDLQGSLGGLAVDGEMVEAA